MSHNSGQGETPQSYRAYLLRLWQETPGQPWRASLQEASTQRKYGFRDLDCMLAFLHAQIGQGGEREGQAQGTVAPGTSDDEPSSPSSSR